MFIVFRAHPVHNRPLALLVLDPSLPLNQPCGYPLRLCRSPSDTKMLLVWPDSRVGLFRSSFEMAAYNL
jgi:hypothetical protein